MDIEKRMREALELAKEAAEKGEIPVGAIVVDERGEVLAKAYNRREADYDPAGHAEMTALREAAKKRKNWRLDGCKLIVTLEPCPMCAGAVAQSRVDAVYFGAYDETMGACGSVWQIGNTGGAKCAGGFLEKECAGVLQSFLGQKRTCKAAPDVVK